MRYPPSSRTVACEWRNSLNDIDHTIPLHVDYYQCSRVSGKRFIVRPVIWLCSYLIVHCTIDRRVLADNLTTIENRRARQKHTNEYMLNISGNKICVRRVPSWTNPKFIPPEQSVSKINCRPTAMLVVTLPHQIHISRGHAIDDRFEQVCRIESEKY